MNLLERVLTLLRANLNSVVEKADDPDKVLRQLQLDMRNQLVQVKTQVATAIVESRKLQKRSQERATEADTWLRKAEQAVQQHNDDVARAALARYNDTKKQAERYHQLQKEQEQFVVTMRGALRQLEAKIVEIDTTIDLLATRRRVAHVQQRLYEESSTLEKRQSQDSTMKAQDAILNAEARARALAALHQRDLDRQLEQLTEEQLLDQQLNDLKARHAATQQPPLLEEGDVPPSSLLRPQPHSGEPAHKRVTENDADNERQTGPLTPDSSSKNRERDQHIQKLLENPSEPSY